MARNSACLLFIILSFCFKSQAQFQKGMRMAGATLGNAFFNSGNYDYTFPQGTTPPYSSKTNSLGITLSPNMGWFVADNIVIGGQLVLGYVYDKTLDIENNITFRKKVNKNFEAGLGAFARGYLGSFAGFAPFGQLNIDAGSGSSNTEGFNYTTNLKESFSGKSSGDFNFGANFLVGVTKMFNANTGLDIFIGYDFSRNKSTFKTTTLRDIDFDGTIDETSISNPTTIYTNHGFMIGAGFQVFFGK